MADAIDTIMTLGDLLYLKLSKSSRYHLAGAGKVLCVKVGEQWRFQRSAIDEWMRGKERCR